MAKKKKKYLVNFTMPCHKNIVVIATGVQEAKRKAKEKLKLRPSDWKVIIIDTYQL